MPGLADLFNSLVGGAVPANSNAPPDMSFMDTLGQNRGAITGLGLGLLSGTVGNPYENVLRGYQSGANTDMVGQYRKAILQRQAQQDAYQKQQDAVANAFKERTVGLQEALAANREDPEKIRVLKAAGIDPTSPEGRQFLFRTDKELTSTDRKAIHSAEDENAELGSTIDALSRARELNKQTYTGLGAGIRGKIGSSIPGANMLPGMDEKASNATREFGQIVSLESIQKMSKTLKGATTDREMNAFREILADPSTPPDIRDRTLARMQTLAIRQQQINKTRTDQLRGGTYYKPGGGQSGEPSAPPDPFGLR